MNNNLTYERFNTIVENNESHKIDFSLKHNQVNLIKYIINNSENNNIENIKEKYFKYTKESLKINNKEISKSKSENIGNQKITSMMQICTHGTGIVVFSKLIATKRTIDIR